jgi:hypothetical protein
LNNQLPLPPWCQIASLIRRQQHTPQLIRELMPPQPRARVRCCLKNRANKSTVCSVRNHFILRFESGNLQPGITCLPLHAIAGTRESVRERTGKMGSDCILAAAAAAAAAGELINVVTFAICDCSQ